LQVLSPEVRSKIHWRQDNVYNNYEVGREPHVTRTIHVRIDAQTEKLLVGLRHRTGWSNSKLIRGGIRALNVLLGPQPPRKIVGLARFRSGAPDLGKNAEHLKGFGR